MTEPRRRATAVGVAVAATLVASAAFARGGLEPGRYTLQLTAAGLHHDELVFADAEGWRTALLPPGPVELVVVDPEQDGEVTFLGVEVPAGPRREHDFVVLRSDVRLRLRPPVSARPAPAAACRAGTTRCRSCRAVRRQARSCAETR